LTPDLTWGIVGVPMALALGLVFGMGPCLLSCLPYLGPVFLGLPGGVRRSWRVLLPLSLGRLTAYSALGGVSGFLAQQVADQPYLPSLQLSLGCATLMVGAVLWLRVGKSACAVALPAQKMEQPLRFMPRDEIAAPRHPRTLLPGGLFLMGLGMALNPCAPLGVVLFSAAASARMADGALLGLSFGLGAIAVPTLVFGLGVAYVGSQLRERLGAWLPRMERASAVLLVAVGVKQLVGWWIGA